MELISRKPLYYGFKKNEITRPSIFGGYFIVCTVILIMAVAALIAPVSAAKLTPTGVEWDFLAGSSCAQYLTYIPGNTLDGDIATRAESTAGDCSALKYSFAAGTNVTQIRYHSHQPSATYFWINNYSSFTYSNRTYLVIPGTSTISPNTWYNDTVSGGKKTIQPGESLYAHYDFRYFSLNEIEFWGDTDLIKPVSFYVSESGNFTNYLSGVNITAGGNTATTNATGWATINFYPPSSAYTYTAVKAGYSDASGTVGPAGLIGGTIYLSMTPGASSATITTEFQAVDGPSNGLVKPVSISLKDVQSNLWSNISGSVTSTWNISVLSNHTIDAYATANGYSGVSRTGLAPTDQFMYELIMWPLSEICTTPGLCGGASDPGTGNVNLLVEVNDAATSDGIPDVSVSVTGPTGATDMAMTNKAGIASFFAKNNSVYIVRVEKAGYEGPGTNTVTSAFGPDTVRIEMERVYVTTEPTNEPGVTTQETVIPGCEDPLSTACTEAKNEDMANSVYEWINLLIPLAGVATALYLLGIRLG